MPLSSWLSYPADMRLAIQVHSYRRMNATYQWNSRSWLTVQQKYVSNQLPISRPPPKVHFRNSTIFFTRETVCQYLTRSCDRSAQSTTQSALSCPKSYLYLNTYPPGVLKLTAFFLGTWSVPFFKNCHIFTCRPCVTVSWFKYVMYNWWEPSYT